MGRNRFVRPEMIMIPISDGDTITIRKELNAGEQRALFDAARIPESDPPKVDPVKFGPAMAAAYLLDWSFTNGDGHKVDITGASPDELVDVLNSLQGATLTEVIDAINRHVVDQAAEEKKILPGEIASSVT